MVNYVTQETFDQAVIENQDALDMTIEEAIEAAIQQFQAQGADLSKVAKTLLKDKEHFEALSTALNNLKIISEDADACLYREYLEIITKECDKNLDYRVYAGKKDAYNIILNAMGKFEDSNHMKECLKAMTSLMTTQPDLLDDKGISIIKKLLETSQEPEVTKLALKWARECCVMQEMNRQKFFEASIINDICPILNNRNPEILQNVCALFRALILDDDIRVEFGKAHDHARGIAGLCLQKLISLLAIYRDNEDVMNDLLQTISALLVRNEFCKEVKNAGAIEIVRDDLAAFKNSDKSVVTVINGLSCIAALSLRLPENSKAFFQAGAPEVILNCMSQHPNNEKVQQSGSWAIRNMVARNRDQCARFLELGAEQLLKDALAKYKKSEYDMKSALRDLGCSVSFKEEWTGKGGKIHTQESDPQM